jgi:tripartite-type tricarboxylate transporter receptor subunit TctC
MQAQLRATLTAVAMIAAAPVFANDVETFYKGRNVSFLVGVSQGGGYDTDLRLVARHITRHIPGRPNAVPQNMTGATGLVMANFMYRVAPRDGSVVALIQNGLPTYQAVGREGVQFDAREFQWIGSLAPTVETMVTMAASGIRTVEDAKKREVIAGSNGASGITYMYPLMMNDMLGTRFKMVTGYPGSGQLNLAMERGEVDGRNNSWTSIKSTKPNWITDKLIHVLVYSGPKQDDLPGVPHFLDLIQDPEDRAVARVVTSGGSLGRPFTVAPGVPADRVAALRTAFNDMLKDPEFIKDAASLRIELQPIPHEELKRVIDELFATPDHLKQRARKYFN